jgi:hypothetical protein
LNCLLANSLKSLPLALGLLLVSGGVAASGSGCVIFLNPDVPGEHCGFKGTSECAACLRENCESAIDACCNDEGCSKESSFLSAAIMATVDVCGEGNDQAKCAYEIDKASTSGNQGVVRACLQKSCASKCFGDGRLHTKCALQNGGLTCSCTNDKESSGDACNNDRVKGTCVLSETGCKCGEYGCSGGSSCSCSFNSGGGSKDCRGIANKRCCLSFEYDGSARCKCDNYGSCSGAEEFSVSSCDESEVLRLLGKRVVESCSY